MYLAFVSSVFGMKENIIHVLFSIFLMFRCSYLREHFDKDHMFL